MEAESNGKVPGLIEETECKFSKTDPQIIEKIATERGIDPEKIKKMMRYNMFTMQQFADLTGMALHSIHGLARPGFAGGKVVEPKINFCYPFPDQTGIGPKFIVRDEKSEVYLKR